MPMTLDLPPDLQKEAERAAAAQGVSVDEYIADAIRQEICFNATPLLSETPNVEAIDPLTAVRVALFNPRNDEWREHFAWSIDATEIIGLTPTGRATLQRLRLNRLSVVNLRRVLHAAGEHPPKAVERFGNSVTRSR